MKGHPAAIGEPIGLLKVHQEQQLSQQVYAEFMP